MWGIDRESGSPSRGIKRLAGFSGSPTDTVFPGLRLRKARGVGRAALTVLHNLFAHHALGRDDLRPLYVVWHVTHRCNLACEFCDDGEGRKYPTLKDQELETDAAMALLEKIRTICNSIYFTGGEPFVRKDFPMLVNRARELGFWPILANTNLSFPNMSASGFSDLDVLIVSLGSTDEARYDKVLRGPPGKTKTILDNLRRCADWQDNGGPKVVVNCVISAQRLHDARGVFRFCREQGFWFSPVPENRGLYLDDKLLIDPEYQSLVDELVSARKKGHKVYGSIKALETLLRGRSFQCVPTLAPQVTPGGDLLVPCRALCFKPINLLQNGSFWKAWRLGTGRYTPGPGCDDRCHLPCYVNNNQWMNHPLEMVVENFRVATDNPPRRNK